MISDSIAEVRLKGTGEIRQNEIVQVCYNGGYAITWSSSMRHNAECCGDASLDGHPEYCPYLRQCPQKPQSRRQ